MLLSSERTSLNVMKRNVCPRVKLVQYSFPQYFLGCCQIFFYQLWLVASGTWLNTFLLTTTTGSVNINTSSVLSCSLDICQQGHQFCLDIDNEFINPPSATSSSIPGSVVNILQARQTSGGKTAKDANQYYLLLIHTWTHFWSFFGILSNTESNCVSRI